MLTMPVGRFTILLGKLAGSVVVAAVGALAMVAGVNYYMGSFTFGLGTQQNVDLSSIGLAPTLPGYIVLGASLFVTLVSALALAIAVSSFAEDVRSAQSIVGYFYFIIFVPMIFLMYTDISVLPLTLRIILLAIPYTHPMLAARASLLETTHSSFRDSLRHHFHSSGLIHSCQNIHNRKNTNYETSPKKAKTQKRRLKLKSIVFSVLFLVFSSVDCGRGICDTW